jgi:hypothetical protein
MDENVFTIKSKVIGRPASRRPSVVTDDLVQLMDQNICGRRSFTISEFPQISCTVLYHDKKENRPVWTGSIWLRIWTSEGLL